MGSRIDLGKEVIGAVVQSTVELLRPFADERAKRQAELNGGVISPLTDDQEPDVLRGDEGSSDISTLGKLLVYSGGVLAVGSAVVAELSNQPNVHVFTAGGAGIALLGAGVQAYDKLTE